MSGVMMPICCRNIHVKSPYPIKREADNLHFTYLDTMGRPVITMTKNNLVEQHIQDFEVANTDILIYFQILDSAFQRYILSLQNE